MGDSANVNFLVNGAYNASVIAGLMLANSFVMKKAFRMKPADLIKMDGEDVMKLTVSVMSSIWIQDWLVNQGVLPDQIITG